MSQALTLARPYARAAFALASEHRQLAGWSQALAVSAQFAGDSRIVSLLKHPNLSNEDAVGLVAPPQSFDPIYSEFLRVLAENDRLVLLPEIAGQFDALRAEAEKVIKAAVTSASALDMVELGKLREALRKRFGRDVEISTAVDPELIGGAVIDTGDVVIDGSLRTKLARLNATLTH